MKLVRARPKAVEDLPEWAKCCQKYIDATLAIGEIIIDLDTIHEEFFQGCGFCFTRNPGYRKRVKDVADGQFCSFDCFDLDETGVPDGNYVEAVAR
jgi:hypothetical protein